jgi:carbon storage regulator
MLILSRKKNESFIIANIIHVKIINIEGGTVKIGIDAPRTVSIFRAELNKEERHKHDPCNLTTSTK